MWQNIFNCTLLCAAFPKALFSVLYFLSSILPLLVPLFHLSISITTFMLMTLNFSTLSIPLITILPLLTHKMHLNISLHEWLPISWHSTPLKRNFYSLVTDSNLLKYTSSSAMAERPRELDQQFQMGGGQFEAIIDWGVTFRAIATRRNLLLRIMW